MKKYNVPNYVRYKNDVKTSIANLEGKMWDEYTRDEMIIKFMPLVENLARKFSTTQQASGVLSINDLLQIGNEGGGRQFSGAIAVVRIYNRALNAYEVYENFQAQRGRFGI